MKHETHYVLMGTCRGSRPLRGPRYKYNDSLVVLGGAVVIVLPLDPRFVGSNPAESDGFLRTIKIRGTNSFGGEVKPSAPFPKILWYVKDPLRYDKDTDRQNSTAISRLVSPRFANRCLLQPEQRNVVDESGMIRTQMGSTIDQEMVAVAWDAL
jgi:hypothetical protein